MKDKRLHILVNDALYNQIHALSDERGISEFIRQAIEEKINNISQNGKALTQLINNNSSAEIKEVQNQLNEIKLQNKILFEQLQTYQELLKLILRRASSGSLNVIALMNATAPQINQSLIGDNLQKILNDDFAKLKL